MEYGYIPYNSSFGEIDKFMNEISNILNNLSVVESSVWDSISKSLNIFVSKENNMAMIIKNIFNEPSRRKWSYMINRLYQLEQNISIGEIVQEKKGYSILFKTNTDELFQHSLFNY